jgi:Skp family chaperone for outer membrane proteins
LASNPQLKQRADAIEQQLKGAQQINRQQAEQAQQVQNDFLRSLNDEVGKNPALRSRFEAFNRRVEAQQVRQRRAQQEFQLSLNKAQQELGEAVRVAAQEAMTARGATIVLDASQVIVNAPTVDITGDVISRLNARKPSIQVVRQRLPQQ